MAHNPRLNKQKEIRPNFSKSVDYTNGMTSSASRFRIVPVESRYKRGRWSCFDHYDKEKSTKFSCPGPSPFQPITPNNDRSARSMSEMVSPMRVKTPTSIVKFQFEPNFDENSDSFSSSSSPSRSSRGVSDTQVVPQLPKILPPSSSPSSIHSSPPKILLPTPIYYNANNKTLTVDTSCHNGRMTPTEMLQCGLEKSLNTAEMEIDMKDDTKKENGAISTSSNNGNSPAMVAIDSKIEQAMDLVKTHLMFAVREEVEVLRAKIVDLEGHIHHLESENAVMREHIPEDILKNLSLNSK